MKKLYLKKVKFNKVFSGFNFIENPTYNNKIYREVSIEDVEETTGVIIGKARKMEYVYNPACSDYVLGMKITVESAHVQYKKYVFFYKVSVGWNKVLLVPIDNVVLLDESPTLLSISISQQKILDDMEKLVIEERAYYNKIRKDVIT